MQDWLKVATEMAEKTRGTRAWVYARVSSHGQQDNGSLDDQEKRCRQVAGERGYRVDHATREVFFSDDPDRPVLDEVLAAAGRGEFDVLLLDKVDRFSRADPGITGHLIIEFQRRGVRVEFAEVPDDSLEGQIMRAVLAIVARVEAVKIKKRTQEGRLRRVTGNPAKGIAPQLFIAQGPLYGYHWNRPEKGKRGHYVIDEETARHVLRLFREVASGKSLVSIIRALNAEGIPTPGQLWVERGIWPEDRRPRHGWQRGIISRIINEPKYYGAVYAKRHSARRVKVLDRRTGRYQWKIERTVRGPDHEEAVPLPIELCPPIVSKELALAAQAQLARHKDFSPRSLKGENRELALLRGGFVVCERCKRVMHARIYAKGTDGSFQGSYVCEPTTTVRDAGGRASCQAGTPNTIAIAGLDRAVWEGAVQAVLDPDFLPAKVRREQRDAAVQAKELAKTKENLQQSINEAERKKRGYLASLGELDAEDKDGRAFTHALIRNQNEELESCRARLAEIETRERVGERQQRALLTIVERLRAWALRISRFTYEQKRALLFALGCKVSVAPRGTDLDGKGSRYIVEFDLTAGLDAAGLVDALEETAPGEGVANHDDSDTHKLLCISFRPAMRRQG